MSRTIYQALALLAAIFALSTPASAQFNGCPGGFCSPAPAAAACTPGTAATNFLARTSGLNATETTAYCELINGLVTDGIITGNLSGAAGCGSVLDALYILATNTTTTAALNLCGTSFSLTTNGSPTFTAGQGYTGDGSSAFLNTGWQPIGGVNFALNSGSIGAYVRTNSAGVVNTDVMGAGNGGSTFTRFQPRSSASDFLYDVNNNSFPTLANSNVQGAWVVSRTASNSISVYKNGSTSPVGTSSSPAVTRSTSYVMILAVGLTTTTAGNFSNYQVAAAFMGRGLNSTEATNLNNRINAYMTALGSNIY